MISTRETSFVRSRLRVGTLACALLTSSCYEVEFSPIDDGLDIGADSLDGTQDQSVDGEDADQLQLRCRPDVSRVVERLEADAWVEEFVCERAQWCIDGECLALPGAYSATCVGALLCTAEELECFESGNVSRCLTRSPSVLGAECASDFECQSDLLCTRRGFCQVGNIGDECLDEQDCDDELASMCGPADACQRGTEGDPCLLGPMHCQLGLLCSTDETCQDGSAGDPCNADSDCREATSLCGPEGCQSGSLGDPCEDNGDCGRDASICSVMRCKGDEGQGCITDAECASGNCSNDHCAPDGFVYVAAGRFTMGSPGMPGCAAGPECELGRFDEETQHEVTLTRPFFLQDHEVTQGEWRAAFGNDPSWFSDAGGGPDCGADCPVERVSWFEAVSYVNALSDRDELDRCYTLSNSCTGQAGVNLSCPADAVTVAAPQGNPYDCEGYRLPTEAEWEYAYRAGSTTAFYPLPGFDGNITAGGSTCESDENLNEIGWYCGNNSNMTEVVSSVSKVKKPNAWGLYDMSGNVWEWAWDEWDGAAYPDDPVTDPFGTGGSFRVRRGGSHGNLARNCRAAGRIGDDPGSRLNILGFRPARTGR